MTNYFRLEDPDYDRKYSGLAQFVVLLAIYPFLLDFSLFSFAEFGESLRIFVVTLQDTTVRATIATANQASGVSGPGGPEVYFWIFIALLLLPVLVYPVAVIACLIRLRFGWLILGMLPAHVFLGIFLFDLIFAASATDRTGFELALKENNILLWFNLAAKIAFVWFALRGRIWSRSFLAFLIYALLVTPILLDRWFSLGLVLQFAMLILCLVLVATFIRVLVMVALDNVYFFRNLGVRRSLTSGGRALLLWLPIALLAVPYFYAHHAIEGAIEDAAYQNLPVNPTAVQQRRSIACEGGQNILWRDTRYTPVRDHVMAYAAQEMLLVKICMDQKLTAVENQLRAAGETGLTAIVTAEFDAAFPAEIDFDEPDNSFPFAGLKDFAVDQSHNAFNTGWGAVRSAMLATLTGRTDAFAKRFRELTFAGVERVQAVRQTADEFLIRANRNLQLTLWWSFAYVKATTTIGHILFAFICLKSFLYVYARVVFHRETGTFLTLGATSQAPPTQPAEVAFTGEDYVIPGDTPSTWFVARRFQAQGKPPRIAWPQPTKAPIARLLHRATVMNRVEVSPGDTDVHYSAMRGAQLIEWALGDGEQVVFDFRNFVGITEGIKVSTLISPRISSMLLGHFIYSVATGPGKLLLMSDGRPHALRTDEKQASFPPERLLAMNTDTRFHVDSETGIMDVYLSTAYMQPAGTGNVVIDVDRQKGGRSGLGRFVTNFLLPG